MHTDARILSPCLTAGWPLSWRPQQRDPGNAFRDQQTQRGACTKKEAGRRPKSAEPSARPCERKTDRKGVSRRSPNPNITRRSEKFVGIIFSCSTSVARAAAEEGTQQALVCKRAGLGVASLAVNTPFFGVRCVNLRRAPCQRAVDTDSCTWRCGVACNLCCKSADTVRTSGVLADCTSCHLLPMYRHACETA